MDYLETLWQKALEKAQQEQKQMNHQDPAKPELVAIPGLFSSRTKNKCARVSDRAFITRESFIAGVDSLKGTPQDQIKCIISEKVDGILREIADFSEGFPNFVKDHDRFTIELSISGRKLDAHERHDRYPDDWKI